MDAIFRPAFVLAALLALAGCGLKPDPPPEFPPSAFGGMGTEMAKCMQYASEDYCLRQTWGGDGDGHDH